MMADSELRRTHPATIAVRTARLLWQMVFAVLGLLVFTRVDDGAAPALGTAGLIVLVVLISIATSWVKWWSFTYGVVGSDLVILEGLLVRKRRTIPIARVHGVNVTADVFMRVLGLVEVVVQTAGGGAQEPEAKIGAIPLDRAEELRNALLYDLAEQPAEQSAELDPVGRISDFRGAFGGAEVRGREVLFEHKVPIGMLVVGAMTSSRVPLIVALGVGVAAQGIDIVGGEIITQTASRAAEIAVPVLIALSVVVGVVVVAVAAVVGVVRDFGFTARRYETRIEIEAGLLERRQVSLPVGRIQAVRVEQPWLKRVLGLSAIEVDTAGLERRGQDTEAATQSKAMVPAARTADVPELLHHLLPEAEDFPTAQALPRRALRFYVVVPTVLVTIGAAVVLGPTTWLIYRPALPWAPAAVLLFALVTAWTRSLRWRRAGIGVDAAAVTLRSGGFGIRHVRLTRSRIQSLEVRQNPFQRRAGLAGVWVVSVSGTSKAIYGVPHLDEAEALRVMRWYEEGLRGSPAAASQA